MPFSLFNCEQETCSLRVSKFFGAMSLECPHTLKVHRFPAYSSSLCFLSGGRNDPLPAQGVLELWAEDIRLTAFNRHPQNDDTWIWQNNQDPFSEDSIFLEKALSSSTCVQVSKLAFRSKEFLGQMEYILYVTLMCLEFRGLGLSVCQSRSTVSKGKAFQLVRELSCFSCSARIR